MTGGAGDRNTHFNVCDAFVDNPQDRLRPVGRVPAAGTAPAPGTGSVFNYCDFDTSWLTQVKATGSYTLPWQQIQIGGVLQNLPGQQVTASWNITQADVAANGRSAAALGRRQHLARGAADQAGDDYTPRRTQLDLRVAKNFQLGGTRSFR